MKRIVEENDEIVFYIKLLPLKIHPKAYKKAKAIVCAKSMALLERSFDGRRLPEPRCETSEVDETIELAKRLGITGTPTLILPDGGVVPGVKDAYTLMEMIETAGLQYEALIMKKEAEAEIERIRQIKEIEDAELEKALDEDTIDAYEDYLSRHREAMNRDDALYYLATNISARPDAFERFKEFIARHPEGLRHIPQDYRLHYIGPGELPVYRIIEMLRNGTEEEALAQEVRSTSGGYESFNIKQISELEAMGVSDLLIDAMLEATFQAEKLEEEVMRQNQLVTLEVELLALNEEISEIQDTLFKQLDPEDVEIGDEEAAREITDEEGTPLNEKLLTCDALQNALERCREVFDIEICIEAAKSDYLCY